MMSLVQRGKRAWTDESGMRMVGMPAELREAASEWPRNLVCQLEIVWPSGMPCSSRRPRFCDNDGELPVFECLFQECFNCSRVSHGQDDLTAWSACLLTHNTLDVRRVNMLLCFSRDILVRGFQLAQHLFNDLRDERSQILITR
jgi:hypothetical protein